MTKVGWRLLGGALVGGVLWFLLPYSPFALLMPGNSSNIAMPALIVLVACVQAAGVWAMRAWRAAPVSTIAGYAATPVWALALVFLSWAAGAGPGGAVIALLYLFPATVLALLLQIGALLGFAHAARQPKAP